MGYTTPEWMNSEQSIAERMTKLWLDYIETFNKDFIDKVNKEEVKK
jgi:hypothetical protein